MQELKKILKKRYSITENPKNREITIFDNLNSSNFFSIRYNNHSAVPILKRGLELVNEELKSKAFKKEKGK